VAVISHATSAADITDQSHSNVGSPTNTPAAAITVIAAIKIIQRLFTFMAFTLLYYNRKCHFGSKGTVIDGKKPYKIPTLHQ
jgi:hypothetical protein